MFSEDGCATASPMVLPQRPPTKRRMGVLYTVSGVVRPSFMAAATTSGLMVDPGSTRVTNGRFSHTSGPYRRQLFGLNGGYVAAASTRPVRVSSTTTDPNSPRCAGTARASAASADACTWVSSVSFRVCPAASESL